MECISSTIGSSERSRLRAVLPRFFGTSKGYKEVCPLGAGNINNTYLVRFYDRSAVVLQRLNAAVFPDPSLVARNFSTISEHVGLKQHDTGGTIFARAVPEAGGNPYHLDEAGDIWRATVYIENSESHRVVKSDRQAFEGGKILGRFHQLLEDLDPKALHQPLPGFHDLPAYCRSYRTACSSHRRPHSDELNYCCTVINSRLQDASILERERKFRRISRRVIHGDPKCDNILFDRLTGAAVAVIDLDTVSAGLLQHDLGDCLRSFCNTGGEKPENLRDVHFDLEICRQVLRGYCAAGAVLSETERSLVFQGVRLLTFELAVRFLADYLAGDHYFKITDEGDNLNRTMVQVRLLESIEEQQLAIESIVAALG